MLLSAEKFSPRISSGLRSLLVPPSGGVVTRALAAASSRGCGGAGGVQESQSRDDGTRVAGDEPVEEEAKAAGQEDVEAGEEQDEEDGCWASYGRREPRRRLPPPIPSLVARGALRRTRTGDGRLVIRTAPVARPERIRARRRGGRLTMQLADLHDVDESRSPLAPRPIPAPIGGLMEAPAVGSEGSNDNVEEATVAAQEEMLPVVVPPRRVPSAGCFEDVLKYSSIGGTVGLHQMPSLRMVH